nr:SurA N-terminal domain-containing protein [Lysobacter solisilvae]
MLQALRDKTSGWIAAAILGVVIISFSFFGIQDYIYQRSDSFAAKVEAPPRVVAVRARLLAGHDAVGPRGSLRAGIQDRVRAHAPAGPQAAG